MTRARQGQVDAGAIQRRRPRARLTRDRGARRIGVVVLVYLLALGGVAARLVQIQVVDAEEFAALGARQRDRAVELPAQRGRLYDREGQVLATSVDAATIYADPRAYRPQERPDGLVVPPAADAAEVATVLAPLLEREPDSIAAQLRRDAHFVYLARQLDWSVGQQVEALRLPGVGVLVEPRRVYPGGALGSQLLGFTGIDGDGLHGLEMQFDGLLKGSPGRLALERAPGGLAIASGTRELLPATPGTDLVLTIDREIQHVAEQVASRLVEEYQAAGSSIVVLEVASGDVLGMASAPGFDGNAAGRSDPELRRNRAVTDLFEPGSVQKAITAAAALEEGVVTAGTTLLVEDTIRVGNKTFSDAYRHPPREMTFREIIETSSNVGTIMVAAELGAQRLAAYLDRFGFGRRLGLGFPGESGGLVLPVDQWWSTSLPTIAIGQGVAVTLLQTASFYATIASDGVAVQPRLVRGTVGEDGRLVPATPSEERRVIGTDTAATLREILAGVVAAPHGTGKRAALGAYTVAGKTGTARKPLLDARGYSTEYVATFVGFAPAEAPRLVVAVMVDEPRPIWGGVVAAPAFAEVMEFALVHRRVPPSHAVGDLEAALDAAARRAEQIDAERRAEEAARQEGPATAPDEPASPPVGDPATGSESGAQPPSG